MSKRLINCFYNESHGGIGDFLRGSIFLYNFCEPMDSEFYIDFTYHEISKYIKTTKKFTYEKEKIFDIPKAANSSKLLQLSSVKEFYSKVGEMTKKEATYLKSFNNFIYTNYSNLFLLNQEDVVPSINHTEKLSENCKKFFKKNLIFSEKINKKAEEVLREAGLYDKEFNIIHFRIGDEKSFLGLEYSSTKVKFEEMFGFCVKNIEKHKLPLLVLADNNELKKYIKLKSKELKLNINIIHEKSGHSQSRPNAHSEKSLEIKKQDIFYIALDMKLATMSKRNESYSVYFWGSGFITWISKIYDIPLFLNKI